MCLSAFFHTVEIQRGPAVVEGCWLLCLRHPWDGPHSRAQQIQGNATNNHPLSWLLSQSNSSSSWLFFSSVCLPPQGVLRCWSQEELRQLLRGSGYTRIQASVWVKVSHQWCEYQFTKISICKYTKLIYKLSEMWDSNQRVRPQS